MSSSRTLSPSFVSLLAAAVLCGLSATAAANPGTTPEPETSSVGSTDPIEDAEPGAVARRRVRLRSGPRHHHRLHRRSVVVVPHGHAHVAVVAHRDPDEPPSFSMGVGGALALAFDDWVDEDGIGESLGVVMPFRWRAWRWLGLTYDLGLVWRVDNADEDRELRVHHGLGLVWYPFPGGWLDAFLSVGANFASVHLNHGHVENDYVEFGAFAGLGAELFFGHWRGLLAEARLMHLHRADADDVEAASGYTRPAPADRLAAMFHLTYQFNLY